MHNSAPNIAPATTEAWTEVTLSLRETVVVVDGSVGQVTRQGRYNVSPRLQPWEAVQTTPSPGKGDTKLLRPEVRFVVLFRSKDDVNQQVGEAGGHGCIALPGLFLTGTGTHG